MHIEGNGGKSPCNHIIRSYWTLKGQKDAPPPPREFIDSRIYVLLRWPTGYTKRNMCVGNYIPIVRLHNVITTNFPTARTSSVCQNNVETLFA